MALGALALLKGSGEVAFSAFDPVDGLGFPEGINTGGLRWADNVSGEYKKGYIVYENSINNPGTFAKVAGIGDVELLCDPAPLEIGNYVWCDSIQNGIQDGNERGIDGLVVELYNEAGLLVATTTTNNSGQYYFNQFNVDTTGVNTDGTAITAYSGMIYSTNYYIVFGNTQFANDVFTIGANEYGITTFNDVNANANDNIDSDVVATALTNGLAGIADGLPYLAITTDELGCATHNYDMGLLCGCVLNVVANGTSVCEGNDLNLTASVGFVTYDWIGPNGFTSTEQNPTIMAADTLATGTYVLTVTDANACIGTATVEVMVQEAMPIEEICDGQTIDLEAEAGHSVYQWYKDGLAIDVVDGGNLQTYTVTTPGEYNYTINGAVLNGTCLAQMCCPIIVVAGVCAPDCVPNVCVPLIIIKK